METMKDGKCRCKLCATVTFLSTHAPKKQKQLLPCWQVQLFPDSTEATASFPTKTTKLTGSTLLIRCSGCSRSVGIKHWRIIARPLDKASFWYSTLEKNLLMCVQKTQRRQPPRLSPPELAGGHSGTAICWKRKMSLPTVRLLRLQAKQESQAFPGSIALQVGPQYSKTVVILI